MIKDPDRAQDLLQETLMKAYRGFDRFEPGTNFRAWIFQILRNAFIDAYHALRREPECITLEDLDEAIHPSHVRMETAGVETPEKIILRKLMVVDIQEALLSLPEKYRTPVVLCDLEECSYKEVGRILGLPLGTVMSRLYRGRRLVQQRILEQGERADRTREVRSDGL
jgi:RNA polymerase sigma-70 factor (ECF subfamily)